MKKVSVLLSLFLISCLHGYGQTNAKSDTTKNKKAHRIPLQVTPRLGLSQPGGLMKDSAFLGNGWQAGIDIGMPFISGARGKFRYDLGINASGGYNSFNAKNGLGYVQSLYKELNSSGLFYYDKAMINARSLQFTIGPRLSISSSRFSISPGIQLGYMSFRRDAYNILYDVPASGGNAGQPIPLLSSKEINLNGFVLKPEIELGYKLNAKTQLSLSASQSFGPAINNQYSLWQPTSAQSSYDQLVGGKGIDNYVRTPYNSLSYQLGMKMDLDPKSIGETFTGKETKKKKKQKEIKETIKKDLEERRKEEEKTAIKGPVITYPADKSVTTLINNQLRIEYKGANIDQAKYRLQIWSVNKQGKRKLVHKDIVPHDWNGIINNFSEIQSGNGNTYLAQMNVIATDTPKSKGPVKVGQAKQADNPKPGGSGFSNLVQFNIGGSCFPDLSVTLDSARCADSNKTKVWGHVTINNTSGLTITGVTITDFKANNFSGPPVAVSNLVPGYSLPPVNNSQFSFNVDENMCNKTLFIRVLITYTCALTGETVSVPCADTIMMPCCSCNYCVDSMVITPGNSDIKDIGNNQAQINQSFSISPTNIQNVTAEIVHLSDSVNNEACRVCDKQPNEVYHFTGANTISWNAGTPINASSINSSNTMPSKLIAWQCNNQGNLDMNLTISLPALADLSCCSMVSTICIRYSFTDKNCKTCDIVVCYTVTRTPKGEPGNTTTDTQSPN